jgi:hypothetical protein
MNQICLRPREPNLDFHVKTIQFFLFFFKFQFHPPS